MPDITFAFPKIRNTDPSCYIDAYHLVLECSKARSPRSFATRLLDLLNKMCPYDRAFVFFLDVNGKLSGKYVINIPDVWTEEYLNYYLAEDRCPREFSIIRSQNPFRDNNVNVIRWADVPEDEFISDYIKAQHLSYSMGFKCRDMNDSTRVVFALDRVENKPFSEIEIQRMQLAVPILDNMYRNFFYQGMDSGSDSQNSAWTDYHFTKRETEIVNLLCQGMSISNISDTLFIAKTTAYKHIAHIYEKVGVSSQKELLFRLMDL